MKTIHELQREIAAWQAATFKGQTVEGKIKHLQREVTELLSIPSNREEQADCLILLIGICEMAGTSMDQLLLAAWEKFEKCKLRKWHPMDADGCFAHMRCCPVHGDSLIKISFQPQEGKTTPWDRWECTVYDCQYYELTTHAIL